MQLMDRDYNNKITVEEFQAYLTAEFQKFGRTVSEKDLEMLKLAFAQADLN